MATARRMRFEDLRIWMDGRAQLHIGQHGAYVESNHVLQQMLQRLPLRDPVLSASCRKPFYQFIPNKQNTLSAHNVVK